jgi:hypothetical protein
MRETQEQDAVFLQLQTQGKQHTVNFVTAKCDNSNPYLSSLINGFLTLCITHTKSNERMTANYVQQACQTCGPWTTCSPLLTSYVD